MHPATKTRPSVARRLTDGGTHGVLNRFELPDEEASGSLLSCGLASIRATSPQKTPLGAVVFHVADHGVTANAHNLAVAYCVDAERSVQNRFTDSISFMLVTDVCAISGSPTTIAKL